MRCRPVSCPWPHHTHSSLSTRSRVRLVYSDIQILPCLTRVPPHNTIQLRINGVINGQQKRTVQYAMQFPLFTIPLYTFKTLNILSSKTVHNTNCILHRLEHHGLPDTHQLQRISIHQHSTLLCFTWTIVN